MGYCPESPPSAGITQIRFRGRQHFGLPSQPGSPSSPGGIAFAGIDLWKRDRSQRRNVAECRFGVTECQGTRDQPPVIDDSGLQSFAGVN